MKSLPYVPNVLVTDVRRKPVMVKVRKDDGAIEEQQQQLIQREMFLLFLEDIGLIQGKKPREASQFLNALYDAIAAQPEELVRARGFWVFEDAHADALARVVRNGPSATQQNPQGGYLVEILHCIGPMLDAVEPENVKPWKEPTAEPKQMNGAEKALPEVAQA